MNAAEERVEEAKAELAVRTRELADAKTALEKAEEIVDAARAKFQESGADKDLDALQRAKEKCRRAELLTERAATRVEEQQQAVTIAGANVKRAELHGLIPQLTASAFHASVAEDVARAVSLVADLEAVFERLDGATSAHRQTFRRAKSLADELEETMPGVEEVTLERCKRLVRASVAAARETAGRLPLPQVERLAMKQPPIQYYPGVLPIEREERAPRETASFFEWLTSERRVRLQMQRNGSPHQTVDGSRSKPHASDEAFVERIAERSAAAAASPNPSGRELNENLQQAAAAGGV
jgi:hypothetical protein